MKQRIHQLNGKIFIQNHEGFTLKFEIPYKQVL
jgi:signal transduction histidine kinase